ncbi:12508_t:CDS:2, partial [Gigaspora rosea]
FIENETCSSLITLNHGNPNIFPSIYMIHPVGAFGGIVAYEMACELMKRKKYVKLVAMVDTPNNLDMPIIPTTLLECLHHIYSLNHDLTELNEIGNDEEK